MLSISEIREELQQGDNKIIADITGLSENYVSLVLNEKRRSSIIIEVAESLIENRKSLKARIRAELSTKRRQKYIDTE